MLRWVVDSAPAWLPVPPRAEGLRGELPTICPGSGPGLGCRPSGLCDQARGLVVVKGLNQHLPAVRHTLGKAWQPGWGLRAQVKPKDSLTDRLAFTTNMGVLAPGFFQYFVLLPVQDYIDVTNLWFQTLDLHKVGSYRSWAGCQHAG